MYDFHTHTFLSDGDLAPTELIRRAIHNGYRVIAVTDHVGPGNVEYVVKTLVKDCAAASKRWDILALPGVEITYVPLEDIDAVARDARALGAKMVNVHGETVVEPVQPGTNLAALRSPHVDVLAHPGQITPDEARIAAERGTFLEISARRGHGFANGHVARAAHAAGARIILDSDAHAPGDLLTRDFAMKVARGAGLDADAANMLLEAAPLDLLKKVGVEYTPPPYRG